MDVHYFLLLVHDDMPQGEGCMTAEEALGYLNQLIENEEEKPFEPEKRVTLFSRLKHLIHKN